MMGCNPSARSFASFCCFVTHLFVPACAVFVDETEEAYLSLISYLTGSCNPAYSRMNSHNFRSGNFKRTSGGSSNRNNNGRQHRIHFLSALASVPVPPKLLKGVQIYTVAANGKTQAATLTLSSDRFTAFIDPPRKDESSSNTNKRSTSSSGGGSGVFGLFKGDKSSEVQHRAIDIGEMDRVQRGQSTQKFEFAKKHVAVTSTKNNINNDFEVVLNKAELSRNPSASSTSSQAQTLAAIQQLDPALSFSIIFRGAHTVDLMAATEGERDEICDTLDQILTAYQRGKIRVSTDLQLLRYIWLDVDKEKTGYVTVQQIGKVLQAINFNMKQKDVITAYDKFGKVIGMDRSRRRKGLTFEQSAIFLHKVSLFEAQNSVLLQCVADVSHDMFILFLFAVVDQAR